jgi:hypothetical protein
MLDLRSQNSPSEVNLIACRTLWLIVLPRGDAKASNPEMTAQFCTDALLLEGGLQPVELRHQGIADRALGRR